MSPRKSDPRRGGVGMPGLASVCPGCRRNFYPVNERSRYCSKACRKACGRAAGK